MTTSTANSHCSRCGADHFADTELAVFTLATAEWGRAYAYGPNSGQWFAVCPPCADEDGVNFELIYKLAELRAGTLFGWWKQHGEFWWIEDADVEDPAGGWPYHDVLDEE